MKLEHVLGDKNEKSWVFEVLFNRILQINAGLKDNWEYEELGNIYGSLQTKLLIYL
ncbi:MAG: hypothetical protein ACW981_20595 [Candidatus Hodarchaeales archaeon]